MPTYVLSKVKRTSSGQKVGDLVDQEVPSAEASFAPSDHKVIISDAGVIKTSQLGSAAARSVGQSSGEIAVLDANGRINGDRLGSGRTDEKFLKGDGQWANPFDEFQVGGLDALSVRITPTTYNVSAVIVGPARPRIQIGSADSTDHCGAYIVRVRPVVDAVIFLGNINAGDIVVSENLPPGLYVIGLNTSIITRVLNIFTGAIP